MAERNEVSNGEGNGPKEVEKIISAKKPLYYIYCIGLNVCLSGHLLYWSFGFTYGFWLFFTAFLLVASAFACLVLCLAEINSCLPFSGGSYGFARVTGGPFIGFLVGTADRVDLLANAGRAIFINGIIIQTASAIAPYFSILFWFCLQLAIVLLLGYYRRFFWSIIIFGGCYSTIFMLIYILSCLPHLHFQYMYTSYSSNDDNEQLSFEKFLVLLPICTLFFNRIQVMQANTTDIAEPRENIPKAMLICFGIIFLVAIFLVFLVASHAPVAYHSSAQASILTLVPILTEAWGLSEEQEKYVALLYLPCLLTAMFACSHAAQQQMIAMAGSKLLMSANFSGKSPEQIARIVVIEGQVIVFLLCSIGYLIYGEIWWWTISEVGILATITSQLGNVYSFLIFRWQYANLPRKFTSPLGVYGAMYCIVIFLLIICGILISKSNLSTIGILFSLFVFIPILIYFCSLKSQQSFSDEEMAVMFLAHVIKANHVRKKLKQQRRTISGAPSLRNLHASFKSSATSSQAGSSSSSLAGLSRSCCSGSLRYCLPFCCCFTCLLSDRNSRYGTTGVRVAVSSSNSPDAKMMHHHHSSASSSLSAIENDVVILTLQQQEGDQQQQIEATVAANKEQDGGKQQDNEGSGQVIIRENGTDFIEECPVVRYNTHSNLHKSDLLQPSIAANSNNNNNSNSNNNNVTRDTMNSMMSQITADNKYNNNNDAIGGIAMEEMNNRSRLDSVKTATLKGQQQTQSLPSQQSQSMVAENDDDQHTVKPASSSSSSSSALFPTGGMFVNFMSALSMSRDKDSNVNSVHNSIHNNSRSISGGRRTGNTRTMNIPIPSYHHLSSTHSVNTTTDRLASSPTNQHLLLPPLGRLNIPSVTMQSLTSSSMTVNTPLGNKLRSPKLTSIIQQMGMSEEEINSLLMLSYGSQLNNSSNVNNSMYQMNVEDIEDQYRSSSRDHSQHDPHLHPSYNQHQIFIANQPSAPSASMSITSSSLPEGRSIHTSLHNNTNNHELLIVKEEGEEEDEEGAAGPNNNEAAHRRRSSLSSATPFDYDLFINAVFDARQRSTRNMK